MNKPLPANPASTIIAGVDTVKPVSYQWARAGSSMTTYWEEVDETDELEEMARLLTLVVDERKDRGGCGKSVDYIKSSGVDKRESQKIKCKEVEEFFDEVIRHAQHTFIPIVDSEVWLHVWDSGGQPVYLDVLPAFLTSRTMFLLLFNASKDLKDKWDVVETVEGKQRKTDYGEMSTLDLLHQWMAAIYGHLARCDRSSQLMAYPRIMLVGTHGDQADKSTVEQEIVSHCTKKLYSDMLYLPPLVVDNTTAGESENEDPGFKTIREQIHEMTSGKLSVKTPVTWVLFRKVLKKLDKKVMQFNEIRTVAAACNIHGQNAVAAVLMFYHEVGALLFYPHIKGLQNVVIIDPKWLVDQLGKLLTLERKVGFDPTRTLWPVLFDKGIALQSLYEAVWKDCGIPSNSLIDLLIYFLLAAPVPPTGLHNRSGKDKEFFLPCVLKFYHGNPATLSINQPHQAAPLFITFDTLGFVPPGFFVRLIHNLATIPKHGQQAPMYEINFSKPVYRNCITFSCQDPRGHEVTLTELPHAFQVNVIGCSSWDLKSLQSVCQRLLGQLDQCCEEVHKCLYRIQNTMTNDRDLKPAMTIRQEYALLCQSLNCPSPSPHYFHLSPDDNELRCSQNTCQLHPSQVCWLASEIPCIATMQPHISNAQQFPSTTTVQPPLRDPQRTREVSTPIDYDTYNEKPELGDLKEWIGPEAASQWKLIGQQLRIPPGSMDAIERDHPMVHDALSAVFTLKALATDIDGHKKLANPIVRWLSEGASAINTGISHGSTGSSKLEMANVNEKKKRDAGRRILDKHIATVTSVVKANPNHFFTQLLGNSLVSRDAYDPENIALSNEQKATKLYLLCGAAVGIASSNFSNVVDILSGYPPLDPVVDEMKREGEKAGLMISAPAAASASQEGLSDKKELVPYPDQEHTVHYDTHDEEPKLEDLVKWISPEAADQWRNIGILLRIPRGKLAAIGHIYPKADDALSKVFTFWKEGDYSAYSWTTVLKVLASDNVGHKRLAHDIARWLLGARP